MSFVTGFLLSGLVVGCVGLMFFALGGVVQAMSRGSLWISVRRRFALYARVALVEFVFYDILSKFMLEFVVLRY